MAVFIRTMCPWPRWDDKTLSRSYIGYTQIRQQYVQTLVQCTFLLACILLILILLVALLAFTFFFFLACNMVPSIWTCRGNGEFHCLLLSPSLLVRRWAAAAAWRAVFIHRIEQKFYFWFFTVHFRLFIQAVVLPHLLHKWCSSHTGMESKNQLTVPQRCPRIRLMLTSWLWDTNCLHKNWAHVEFEIDICEWSMLPCNQDRSPEADPFQCPGLDTWTVWVVTAFSFL